MKKILVIMISTLFLGTFFWKSNPKNVNPPTVREDIISRVENFPKDILFQREKEQILTMLNEVRNISFFADPDDLGGQIGGSNRQDLIIGKKLLNKDDFHMKRSLMIVLLHESRHWLDLKKPEFKSQRIVLADSIGDNAYISKMALLEFYAYKEQYELTLRINNDDNKFLLPKCEEFYGNGSRKINIMTPELFGFGRSLYSIYNTLHSSRLNDNEANQKFVAAMEYYKKNYKELGKFQDRFVIDCNHKFGF